MGRRPRKMGALRKKTEGGGGGAIEPRKGAYCSSFSFLRFDLWRVPRNWSRRCPSSPVPSLRWSDDGGTKLSTEDFPQVSQKSKAGRNRAVVDLIIHLLYQKDSNIGQIPSRKVQGGRQRSERSKVRPWSSLSPLLGVP